MALRKTLIILLISFCCCLLCNSCLKKGNTVTISTEEIKDREYQPFLKNDSILRVFFSCKTSHEINHFIDPEMGLTILYVNGCYPQYEKLDSVSWDKDSYDLPYWIIEDILQCLDFKHTHIDTFQHTDSPVFNGEMILQYGAFIDESDDKNIMSRTIQHLIRTTSMEDGDISYLNKLEKDYYYYKDLESKSLRVILTEKGEERNKSGIRIFHFTEKQNKWYLTLMDFYSFDTSV